jgi:hypothetical protein
MAPDTARLRRIRWLKRPTRSRETFLRTVACYIFVFLTLTPLLALGRMWLLVLCCAMLSTAGYGLMCQFIGHENGYAAGHRAGYREGHQAGQKQPPPIPKPRPVIDWQSVNQAFGALPAAIDRRGFIYVVLFTSGTVKVGQTINPRNRLRSHRSDGAAFGAQAVRVWVSPPHTNFSQNEDRLIRFCSRNGSRIKGEYFRGIDFAAAVKAAETFTYHGATVGVSA